MVSNSESNSEKNTPQAQVWSNVVMQHVLPWQIQSLRKHSLMLAYRQNLAPQEGYHNLGLAGI